VNEVLQWQDMMMTGTVLGCSSCRYLVPADVVLIRTKSTTFLACTTAIVVNAKRNIYHSQVLADLERT